MKSLLARANMIVFGSRGSLGSIIFFVLAALLPLACPSQAQDSAVAQFSAVVIPVGGDPDAIAVVDVNHDDAPDIIVANPEAGTVAVLLGDRKGHFQKAPGSPFPAGHFPAISGSETSTATAIPIC